MKELGVDIFIRMMVLIKEVVIDNFMVLVMLVCYIYEKFLGWIYVCVGAVVYMYVNKNFINKNRKSIDFCRFVILVYDIRYC